MKILIIDNYDSFTYNLYQYIGELLLEKEREYIMSVVRNNAMSLEDIMKNNYDRIVISPGPGDPSDTSYFGVCSEVILKLGKTIPLFGVCLGMQGIAYYFGGKVVKAKQPMHGKTSMISHDAQGVFEGLPQSLEVMRYHSLIVDEKSLPKELEITAKAKGTNEIMGIRHKEYPIEGVQFHPESFATDGGKEILKNFLRIT